MDSSIQSTKTSPFFRFVSLGWFFTLFLALCFLGNCGAPETCQSDKDCEGKEDLPVCVSQVCVACRKDNECPKSRPICRENRCVKKRSEFTDGGEFAAEREGEGSEEDVKGDPLRFERKPGENRLESPKTPESEKKDKTVNDTPRLDAPARDAPSSDSPPRKDAPSSDNSAPKTTQRYDLSPQVV